MAVELLARRNELLSASWVDMDLVDEVDLELIELYENNPVMSEHLSDKDKSELFDLAARKQMLLSASWVDMDLVDEVNLRIIEIVFGVSYGMV